MESSVGAAAEAAQRRREKITTIADSMIDAAKLEPSQQRHLVKLLDAPHARFVWRYSALLTRIVPSEAERSLEGTASFLTKALRGLGEDLIATIAHHGLKPDDREPIPKCESEKWCDPISDDFDFEKVANDVDDVKRLLDSVRHLVDCSREAVRILGSMIDPKSASARDRKVAARREIVHHLAAVWEEVAKSRFTGVGCSAAFALAFMKGVGLTTATSKSIENDWAEVRRSQNP